MKLYADRAGISYPLLSDPDSKVIRAFGILNEQVKPDSAFFGIPHPVTYLLDEHGVVRGRYSDDDYRVRYTASDILARHFNVAPGKSRTEWETDHLRLMAAASGDIVRSGQRIALAVELQLKPRMHVYAPGVEGYIPVAWTMEDSEGWSAAATEFPPPLKKHLPAIGETVLVYQDRLLLLRDLTVGQEARLKELAGLDGTILVKGKLRYQACDDTKCYVPQDVPLTWRLRIEAVDRQRAPEPLRRQAPAQ